MVATKKEINMKAYIIDTEKFQVAQIYNDRARANYDMSDNYGWHPNNRFKLFISHHDAYDYWLKTKINTGDEHKILETTEDDLFDMFSTWLNNGLARTCHI